MRAFGIGKVFLVGAGEGSRREGSLYTTATDGKLLIGSRVPVALREDFVDDFMMVSIDMMEEGGGLRLFGKCVRPKLLYGCTS